MSRAGYIDKRGNAADRARRRAWLLATFDDDLGPDYARCAMRLSADCDLVVDAVTLSVDRIVMGGTYARGNIQPGCKPCQDRQGGLAAQRVPVNRDVVQAFRDAVHARSALRESAAIVPSSAAAGGSGGHVAYFQLSDDEFAELVPPLSFRDWLVEWHESRREPDTETLWGDEQRSA